MDKENSAVQGQLTQNNVVDLNAKEVALRKRPDAGVSATPAGGEQVPEELDAPARLTKDHGGKSVYDNLHRMSLHIGQQIANGKSDDRVEGPLYARGRGLFNRWQKYFCSLATHNHFGPVLFMFKYDSTGNLKVRDSVMIVLENSCVEEGKNVKAMYLFKIKTESKRWIFASEDSTKRDHWMQSLRHLDRTN